MEEEKITEPVKQTKTQQNTEARQLLVRTKQGVYLTDFATKDFDANQKLRLHPQCITASFTKDGSEIIVCDKAKLVIYNADSLKAAEIKCANQVMKGEITGSGRFFQTLEKVSIEEYFCCIYDIPERKKVFSKKLCNAEKQSWPNVCISDDDSLACVLLNPSEIVSFLPLESFKEFRKFPVKDCADLSISPGYEGRFRIAALTPEKYDFKGKLLQRGRIKIFSSHANKYQQPIVSKEIKSCTEISLKWSACGKFLLVNCMTDMDKNDESYYGTFQLLFINVQTRKMQNVELQKGEIHGMEWNPRSSEFIVICGFMPASSVLFGNDCKPKFIFGKNHRNHILFNPFPKYLMLAGFGNLSGDIEIWDMDRLKSIGKCNSNSASYVKWSPDGTKFLTTVCSPHIRVDNDYKIFDLAGNLLYHANLKHTSVFDVQWRPGKFTKLPMVPKVVDKSMIAQQQKGKDVKPRKIMKSRLGGGGDFVKKLIEKERGIQNSSQHVGARSNIFGNQSNRQTKNYPPGFVPGQSTQGGPKKKRRQRKKRKKGRGGGGNQGKQGNNQPQKQQKQK